MEDGGQRTENGVDLIAAERRRQTEVELWTSQHDDMHAASEMALMAAHYVLLSARDDTRYQTMQGPQASDLTRLIDYIVPVLVPEGWYSNPKDRLRNLIRAGALIAAEIDRLNRQRSE